MPESENAPLPPTPPEEEDGATTPIQTPLLTEANTELGAAAGGGADPGVSGGQGGPGGPGGGSGSPATPETRGSAQNSAAKDVMTNERTSLDDDNLEVSTLLRVNRSFIEECRNYFPGLFTNTVPAPPAALENAPPLKRANTA